MLPGEAELVSEWTGLPGEAKSVNRFERSNGLDTALYKNYLFLHWRVPPTNHRSYVVDMFPVAALRWEVWGQCKCGVYHSVGSVTWMVTLRSTIPSNSYRSLVCIAIGTRRGGHFTGLVASSVLREQVRSDSQEFSRQIHIWNLLLGQRISLWRHVVAWSFCSLQLWVSFLRLLSCWVEGWIPPRQLKIPHSVCSHYQGFGVEVGTCPVDSTMCCCTF